MFWLTWLERQKVVVDIKEDSELLEGGSELHRYPVFLNDILNESQSLPFLYGAESDW